MDKKNDVKPISFKEKNPFSKITSLKILNINGVENPSKELIAQHSCKFF